jgi:hypothetical protein
MLTRRLLAVLFGVVLLGACGIEPDGAPAATGGALGDPDPSLTSPPDDDGNESVPRLSDVREDVPRAAPPPEEVRSSAAHTLGLDRWSCAEVVEATHGRLRRLAVGGERFEATFCYVHNGTGSGDFFAPPSGAGPWQAGVLYTPHGVAEADLDGLDIEQVLVRGGVLLAVDFDVLEGPIPADSDPDDPDGGYLVTRAEGEPAVLRRTASGLLLGVWFTGAPDERVRVTLMTGLDEEQALALMGAAVPDDPGR